MKYAQEFDYSRAFWDAWREFHIDQTPWIRFATGELILKHWFKPQHRQHYKEYGVRILGTGDRDCPRLALPSGEKFPTAWFDGMQTLLLDLETERVVGLWDHGSRHMGFPEGDTRHTIPVRFRGPAAAYFPGECTPPVGGPISLYGPEKVPKDLAAKGRETFDACRAWLGMTTWNVVKEVPGAYERVSLTRVSGRRSSKQRAFSLPKLAAMDFKTMTENERYVVANSSIENGRDKQEHAYLTLAK